MTLNRIRYLQQYQQLNRQLPNTGNVANYTSRDAITGQRTLTTADGGKATAKYVSNSVVVGTIAISQFSPLGLPAYISQKPH